MMQKISLHKLYSLLILWTLSLIGAIVLFNWLPIPEIQHSAPMPSPKKVFSKHHYSANKNTTAPTIVFVGRRHSVEYLDLKMRFRVYKYSPYANIFQTSSFNEGMRLELFEASNKDIGAIFIMGDYSKENPSVINVIDKLMINKEYIIEIRTDYWKNMFIYLNGELIHTMPNKGKSVLSHFILGNGFDGTRSFLGEVDLEYLDVYGSEILDLAKEGFWERVLDLLQLKNQHYLFGFVMVFVNILTTFRILYFVWYEPS